jgi:hypothetical protein
MYEGSKIHRIDRVGIIPFHNDFSDGFFSGTNWKVGNTSGVIVGSQFHQRSKKNGRERRALGIFLLLAIN